MVKTYCDICSREINKLENEFRLECAVLNDDSQQYDYVYKDENVCEDCIHSINNFIITLISKKDLNKDITHEDGKE